MKPQIAIIGAGPAGLVLAISLARRGVASIIFEAMEDPFRLRTYNPNRSYAIDITGHGLKAIQYIDAVSEFDSELIGFNGLKLNGKRMSHWDEPGWIGSRGDIVRVLTDIALQRHADLIDIRFQSKLQEVDIQTGELKIADFDGETEQTTPHGPFAMVVAADGGGSVARQQASIQDLQYQLTVKQIPFYLKMLALDKNTENLDPGYLQVLSKRLLMVAGAINGPEGKQDPLWFCAVPFSSDHRYTSAEDVRQDLTRRCPEVLQYCSDAALDVFADVAAQNIGRITSSSKLWAGRVVFLGDAAISYPPIGQGINGAMESAIELDQALIRNAQQDTEFAASVPAALQDYNAHWLPETQAVAWMGSKANQASRWHVLRGLVLAKLGSSPMDLIKSSTMSYAQAMRRTRRLGPIWWG